MSLRVNGRRRAGRRGGLLVVAGVLAAASVAGCEADVSLGASAVEQSEVEQTIASELEAQVGVLPEIDCPGDLDAEVGATQTCTLTDPDTGSQYPVAVSVTNVDGQDVNFDFEVADQPTG